MSMVDQQLSDKLSEFSARIGRTVACLRKWQALEYSGHFIDAHPEMKERILIVARQTDEVLEQWGASVKPKEEQ